MPEQKKQPTQKTNYMSQLDEWTEHNVIAPIAEVAKEYCDETVSKVEGEAAVRQVSKAVKKAVREKVLESYRNGQAAKTLNKKGDIWKRS